MENSQKFSEWDRQVFGVARARSHNNLSWAPQFSSIGMRGFRHAQILIEFT